MGLPAQANVRNTNLMFAGLAAAIGLVKTSALAWGGPIETRNYRSIALPFLRLEPRGPVLASGQRAISIGLVDTNDFRRMSNGSLYLSEKYEYQRLQLRYRQSLGHRSDVTIDFSLISRDGGFMDPLIDIYHRLILNLKDNPRIGLPYGLSEVIIPGSPRFGSAAGIADIPISITHQFSPRLQGTFAVKLPVGDSARILGSGNVDAAVGLGSHVPWGQRWSLDFQAGVVAQSPAKALESTRGLVHQETVAIERHANARDNYVLQWQDENSALQTGIPGSDSPNRVLTLGLQHQDTKKRSWEAYFTVTGDWLNYRVPELVNVGPEFTYGIRWISKI